MIMQNSKPSCSPDPTFTHVRVYLPPFHEPTWPCTIQHAGTCQLQTMLPMLSSKVRLTYTYLRSSTPAQLAGKDSQLRCCISPSSLLVNLRCDLQKYESSLKI